MKRTPAYSANHSHEHANAGQGTGRGNGTASISRRTALLGLTALLGGCATSGDLLDDLLGSGDDAPLPGKREPLFSATARAGKSTEPVLLPQAIGMPQWLQPGGTASSVVGNPALAENIRRRWRVQAARASSGANRLSAPPIVANGRVLVLDAFATLRAFDAASGRRLWERSLVPQGGDANDGFGGGICSDGTRVFAATGLGELVALSLGGTEQWRVSFKRPLRTPPVYANGRIFVRDNADVLHAVAAGNGGRLWDYQGPAGRTRLISAAAPSVRGNLLACPFSGGDIVLLDTAGNARFSHTLTNALTITDIAARPLLTRNTIYGVAAQGDIAAISTNGDERWSLPLGGRNTPWLAGNHLFHLQGRNRLHAIHATSGKLRYSATLDGTTLAGPVMGGGRLFLAGANGQLLEVLAEGGNILKRHKVGESVRIAPIIAAGSLYVLDDEGGLSRYA